MAIDHYIRKNIYLTTQAAKARLALRKLCRQYRLNIDEVMEDYDEDELVDAIGQLQAEATDDARRVVGGL
jgi:hypothetical protein